MEADGFVLVTRQRRQNKNTFRSPHREDPHHPAARPPRPAAATTTATAATTTTTTTTTITPSTANAAPNAPAPSHSSSSSSSPSKSIHHDGGAFRPSSPTGRRRRQSGRRSAVTHDGTSSTGSADAVVAALRRHIETTRASDFFGRLVSGLRASCPPLVATAPADARPSLCVCYGIGPLSTSLTSQHQFALCVLLVEEWKIPNAELFDPVLTPLDVEIAQRFGFAVIASNEHGARAATSPTLFYMPHCGDVLYNNVVRANWSAEALSRLVVVGNSFDAYSLMPNQRKLAAQSPFLVKIAPHATEHPLPTPAPAHVGPYVFNDTSAHWFDAAAMAALGDGFWAVGAAGGPGRSADGEVV
ncbi:hypothetical protein DFJ73DRAFT_774621 [Zopfochytrium polystomum]|nr:hypothetical protein DFJ73DRAFT_774621 [Zopfochytrium polystomum]